jgi:hypothetical protein
LVNDTSTKVVLSKATVGAAPAGLKDAPVMLILWVEVLTTVLKITGVVALQAGTARNMDAIRNNAIRNWLSTLGILLVSVTSKISALDRRCKGGLAQVWAFCGVPQGARSSGPPEAGGALPGQI